MKNIAQLRECLSYRPFRSFWLETIGGTRIFVEKPECFIAIDERFVVLLPSTVIYGRLSDLTDTIEVEDPAEAK